MRIESVTAHAFGPFANRTLNLAHGLTVIHGPNESGKSSWHAALFAGLCGMRRSRGPLQRQDRRFAELHHPWNDDGWEVSVVIGLDDGRRIELRQDLEGRVGGRATDLTTGKDVSSEIITEGSPDGSRWLGLDRRSFLQTACIGQSQILSLLENAELLRDDLQRAVATGGHEATAAEAIARLTEFRSTNVGGERARNRPLQRARARMEEAKETLREIKEEHGEASRLLALADELGEEAKRLREELHLLEAARAVEEAETMERKLERARTIARRFPEGKPTRPMWLARSAVAVGAVGGIVAVGGGTVYSSFLGVLVAAICLATVALMMAFHQRALARVLIAEKDWAELQAFLDGRSVEEMTRRAEGAKERAREMTSRFPKAALDAAELGENGEARIPELRESTQQALSEAEKARGRAEERSRRLQAVSEAEEELEAAEAELDRIRSLDETLQTTLGFLRRAQEEAHRSIAPVLAGTLRHWISRVTADRYSDVVVDPETLEVKIRGEGYPWRRAGDLSSGTAEQVYILLRLALTQHLSQAGEACPLVLDDITVQSDRERTEALMHCLHEISRERQVILFSQEEEVLRWAKTNLMEGRDGLLELDRNAVQP